MSLDGFVAGPSQSVDNPLGIGGMRLHEWVFPLAVWRAMHGLEGGEVNASSAVVEESLANVGATVRVRGLEGFVRVNNVLDARYETFGTFAANGREPGSPVQRFLTPALPLDVLAGVQYAF